MPQRRERIIIAGVELTDVPLRGRRVVDRYDRYDRYASVRWRGRSDQPSSARHRRVRCPEGYRVDRT